MTSTSGALRGPTPTPVPPMLGRTVEAVIFDWDGTAVPDRRADASAVRSRVEALCAAGVHVVVVSGTHVGNVDGQLAARPSGPGRLHLCLNRGSEVLEVTSTAVTPVWERRATDDENAALDRAAALVVERLRGRGIAASIVSERLNRRKIDLIEDPAWADPPKSRIGELLGAVDRMLAASGVADLAEVVAIAAGAAVAAGLPDAKVTTDVKHAEIGLTDKSDSARWAAAWLARRGITGELVLVAGDEFGPIGGVPGSDSLMLVSELARATAVSVGVEPGGVPGGLVHLGGGPNRFVKVLDEQLRRRRHRRVPHVDDDPAWVLPLPDDPSRERVAEALGALGNGDAGMRAAREENGAGASPLFAVNGIYTGEDVPRLLEGPVWTNLAVQSGALTGRRLDLRTGVLARDDDSSGVRTLRFLSAARPDVLGLRAEGPDAELDAAAPFAPNVAAPMELVHGSAAELARTSTPGGGGIVVAVRDRSHTTGGLRTIERLGVWAADPTCPPGWDDPAQHLDAVDAVGFDRLLAAHRKAWAERWADAEVSIEGDADDQLASRFAVFHLLNAAPDSGEAAVGPRGLTGHAYGGHVFWDADVFVLPALAAIRPGAARAMVEYRVRRLPAARESAAELRLSGARFPWESATDGSDVTPRHVVGPHGQRVPVRTGVQQEHIVADVAWAAHEYAAWSGDAAFVAGPGCELLIDTARYWASRVRDDGQGRAHIYGVMGPDEYHEAVDDNTYTNVMARWNLRRAAELVEEAGDDGEALVWRELADRLVDGWDPRRRLHEQFAGYWELEPLLAEPVARRPFAADLLLGRKRVAGSQLIKQPDVLMLHHLVPDEMRPGSLSADLAFYEPRTSHGSSLSPAIHAAVLARAGRPDDALDAFRLAARLDLDDLTGTTASGLHLATMGGLWQALAYGFLGLRPRPDHLAVAPRLPEAWEALALRFRFHGIPVGIRAERRALHVTCDEPLAVRVGEGRIERCLPPGRTFGLDGRDDRSSR